MKQAWSRHEAPRVAYTWGQGRFMQQTSTQPDKRAAIAYMAAHCWGSARLAPCPGAQPPSTGAGFSTHRSTAGSEACLPAWREAQSSSSCCRHPCLPLWPAQPSGCATHLSQPTPRRHSRQCRSRAADASSARMSCAGMPLKKASPSGPNRMTSSCPVASSIRNLSV